MDNKELFSIMPVWANFILIVMIVFVGLECGVRLGIRRVHQGEPENEGIVSALVGGAVALLAFLLAFTFSMASEQFQARRMLVVEEANAIGTAYQRADFLPEPLKADTKDLLRQYVDARLNCAFTQGSPSLLAQAIEQSRQLQKRLWTQASAAAQQNIDSELRSLFAASLNEIAEVQRKRELSFVQTHIPGPI